MNLNNKNLCTISIVIPLNKMFDTAGGVFFCLFFSLYINIFFVPELSTSTRIINITVKGRKMTSKHTSGLEGHQRTSGPERDSSALRTGRGTVSLSRPCRLAKRRPAPAEGGFAAAGTRTNHRAGKCEQMEAEN